MKDYTMTNIYPRTLIALSLLFTGSVGAQAAEPQCLVLGGSAIAQAISKTSLIASLSGSFAGGARAEIRAETKTDTGMVLEMEHHFYNSTGGLLNTKDKAILTTVEGRENIYMLEIRYEIDNASGSYEGYNGDFNSYGLIDLNQGTVVLRYKGEICK